MRLVARSARIPVPRIVEAGLVTVTRTGDLASSSSGKMFSCSVFITVGRASEGGLVASTSPRRRTSLLSAATQPVFDRSTQRSPSASGIRNSGVASDRVLRTDEHKSELQSLMRISYAGLCLKKKNHIE